MVWLILKRRERNLFLKVKVQFTSTSRPLHCEPVVSELLVVFLRPKGSLNLLEGDEVSRRRRHHRQLFHHSIPIIRQGKTTLSKCSRHLCVPVLPQSLSTPVYLLCIQFILARHPLEEVPIKLVRALPVVSIRRTVGYELLDYHQHLLCVHAVTSCTWDGHFGWVEYSITSP